ncbi:hypothetical protein ABBQ32_011992 [Trebouxia sp. C0010 RCD-2024]
MAFASSSHTRNTVEIGDGQSCVEALLAVPRRGHIQQYYEEVLKDNHDAISISPDSGQGKGKGVIARQDLCNGDNILREPPLVAGQHTTNKCHALACSQCFQFLGSIEMQLAWCQLMAAADGTPLYDLQALTAIQNQVPFLPYSKQWQLPQPVPCSSGCQDEVYCSQKCAAAAWAAHHSVLCCHGSQGRVGKLSAATSSEAGPSSGNHAEEMRAFQEHANSTNDVFLVAAQAVANTLIRAREALCFSGQDSKKACWHALLKGWEPYHMGWKKPWWQSVACPDDVDNEQEFRQELKDLASDSLNLLKAAIYDERFPALFDLDVYGSIVGMFELNNLGIMSPSPIQEYSEAVADLPHADKAAAQAGVASVLSQLDLDTDEPCVEGTAFYAVQSCFNHSCQPNAHALRSGDDPNSFAVIVALQAISTGDEVTLSYIDESLPFEERQEALQDYGFVCRCPLCQQQQ